MKTQTFDLNKLGLLSMDPRELIEVDGGDVDGLMRGSTPDLSKVVTLVHNVGDFFRGIWAGL